jgi:para-nitrobenzyl esterase
MRVDPEGVIDAGASGPAAPQPIGGAGLVPGLEPVGPQSEDCLVLDVWAPEGARDLPVLVWIHGGSFLTGATSPSIYDGSTLARDGAVVVSIQYRVGPFGFLDLRALGGAAIGAVTNPGLHDAIAAFEWVRRHIAAFGGDPTRVCAIGESAGGGVILHLLGAPGRAEWFDRAIIQSGSTGRTFEPDAAAVIAERCCVLAECAGARDLAAAPVDALVRASVAVQADPHAFAVAGLMPFHPAVDGDIVLDPPSEAITRGAAGGCDVILGVTRDEMNLFVMDAELERARLVRRVEKYLGTTPARATAIIDAYVDDLRGSGRRSELIDAWGAIYSDREMLLPARAALDGLVAAHPSVYGYRFDWDAPPRPDGRPLGAAHGLDIPFTFGNFDPEWEAFLGVDRDAGAGRAAREISAAVRASWVAFAATGVPASDWTGPWPRWDFGDRRAVVLGDPIGVRADPIGERAVHLDAR